MAQLSANTYNAFKHLEFSDAAGIDFFFKEKTGRDFIDWFNARLAGKGAFAARRIQPGNNETLEDVKKEHIAFWNEFPIIYNKPKISLFEFVGLMSIVINETAGRFKSTTEICGAGVVDKAGVRHPGLAYAFDKLTYKSGKTKRSYNTLKENKTAFDCFTSKVFCAAHKDLAPSDKLSGDTNPALIDEAWKGNVYPSDKWPVVEDMAQTGFIMQSDFYKFRGRGPIQLTGRLPYRRLARHIQRYSGTNPVLLGYKAKWQGLSDDDAATVSRDADWEKIFGEKVMASYSLKVFAELALPSKNIFVLENELDNLNSEALRGGSFYFIGRMISGSDPYAKTVYKPRVMELLEALAEPRQ